MSKQQNLANDVVNHIRKIEDCQSVIATMNKIIAHEMASMHNCLAEGAQILKLKTGGGAVPYGGGTDKT